MRVRPLARELVVDPGGDLLPPLGARPPFHQAVASTSAVVAHRMPGEIAHGRGTLRRWHPASHRCPSTSATRAPRSCSRRCAGPTAPSSTSSPRSPATRSCSSGGRPSAGTLLYGGALPARDRELLILRTGYLLPGALRVGPARRDRPGRRAQRRRDRSGGRRTGRRRAGRPSDADLLRAADELHADSRIGDATWAPSPARWDEQQLIEVCMVVGQYHLVAFTLNSLGVEPESDDFPALPA